MSEIQAVHTVENGLFKVTTTFKIPQAFIENGLDYGVAEILGYQKERAELGEEGLTMVANPVHPIDFILDKFHEQLQRLGQQVVANQAINQARLAAEAQFKQALEATNN